MFLFNDDNMIKSSDQTFSNADAVLNPKGEHEWKLVQRCFSLIHTNELTLTHDSQVLLQGSKIKQDIYYVVQGDE